MLLSGGVFMKNIRNIVIGIIIGIMLTVTVNAAVQEYALKQSEWNVVVDGQVVEDARYPVLLMDPGYNYLADGNFHEICEKAGIPFEVDVPTKEIRISTQEVKAIPTPTVTPTVTPALKVEYVEPYTIERDGVKKVFAGDVNKLLKPRGYELVSSGNSDWTLILTGKNGLLFDNIKYTTHEYNGNPSVFIDYQFFIDNIKPLITD
jgi:hypothetical protein